MYKLELTIIAVGLALLGLIVYVKVNSEPMPAPYIFCLDPNSREHYDMPPCLGLINNIKQK